MRSPGFTAVWIHRSRYSLSVIFAPSKSWPRSRSRNFLIKFACASRMGPWIVSVVVVAFVGFAIAAASNCPNVTPGARGQPSLVATADYQLPGQGNCPNEGRIKTGG